MGTALQEEDRFLAGAARPERARQQDAVLNAQRPYNRVVKICHIITRLIVGGAQENTLLTCRGLHERGHDVTLISGIETGPEGSLWSEAEAIGCRLVRLESLRRAIRPAADVRAIFDLTRILHELAPDVVHTHSSKAGILGRIAARRASGTSRRLKPVAQELAGASRGLEKPAARGAGIPLIIHTIHGMSFNRTQPWSVRLGYRLLEKRVGRFTDCFICVADAMTRQAVEAGLAPRERFMTVRSGMETDRFFPDSSDRAAVRAEWGVADDHIVIGTIARLFANKGYDEIIAALPAIAEAIPEARFVWVGDGKHREPYLRRVAGLGLSDRVVLTGLAPPSAIPRLLRGMDLLVHASRWEGLPRALPQALLTEVPAVSFDNDGAPEVVEDGATGRLVPYGDAAKLAETVIDLALYPDLRLAMGKEGRRRCLEEFDWRVMVERIEGLYGRAARSTLLV